MTTQDQGTVTAYPQYPGEPSSPLFSVVAGGKEIFVHSCADFHAIDYARFAFTGRVRVEVTFAGCGVNQYSISPRAYGISPTQSGNTIAFDLDWPRKLILYVGGKELALFAEAPEVNAPNLDDANVKNIMDYGVDASGSAIGTTVINEAIAKQSALGDKRILYFPRGVYRTGTIMMKSNVTLYIAPDALITAAIAAEDYPEIPRIGYGNGAFVYFDRTEHAGIMGRGTLCARGFTRHANNVKRDVHACKLHGCRDTQFRDVILLDSYTWAWHPVDCDRISAINMNIINQKDYWWSDGFDFDVCRDGLVEDCFFWGSDDATCVKGCPGAPVKPNERIMFRGCVLSSNANGFRYGFPTESAWSYSKDITCENNHYVAYSPWENEVGIKIEAGKSRSDNIRVINCSFEKAPHAGKSSLFIITGNVGEVLFDRVVTYHPENACDISAGNVTFRDFRLDGEMITSWPQAEARGIRVSGGARATFAGVLDP